MTPDQMKAVAERVYPGRKWSIWRAHGQHPWAEIYDKGEDGTVFRPKLDGNERERAQALDCIVAADKIAGASDVWEYKPDSLEENIFLRGILCSPIAVDKDPLTAALLAILEAKK